MMTQRSHWNVVSVARLLALVLPALMLSLAYAQGAGKSILIKETFLDEYRPEAYGGFSHMWVAYVEEEGEKVYVRLNGQRHGPYDNISRLFRFSDDGSHIVFAAKRDDSWHVVVDGEERWSCRDLWWGRYTWGTDLIGHRIQMQTSAAAFYFMPDKASIVYAAKNADGKWAVHVNGRTSKAFHAVGFTSTFFYKDQVCYPAWPTEDDSRIIVIGPENQLGPFEASWRAVVSSNRQHFCLQAKRDGRPILVVDGKVVDQGFDDIGGYTIDAAGQVAYGYKRENKWKVYFGDEEIGGEFDDVYYRFLEISPNGKNIAFWAKENGNWYVVTKEKRFSGFEGLFFKQENEKTLGIFWGPDSEHLAYVTRTKDGTKLALDGEIRCDIPSFYTSDPQAIVAWLVANPANQTAPECVHWVDGQLSFIRKSGDSNMAEVMVGGRVYGPYDTVDALHVSPNKKHYAYTAGVEGRETLVIDGVPVVTFDKIHRFSLTSNETVGLLGIRGNKIFGVQYRLAGLPE